MIELDRSGAEVVEPARRLKVDGEVDVLVVGGGIAGTAAGIAASRMGARTLIVERESALGGLATVGLVNIPLDYVGGIGQEMFDRLKALQGLWHRNSDPEKHKLVLDRMVREAGCGVLFHTMVVDAIVKHGQIRGVVVESKSGRQAILAKRVVDCSGDGDAAAMAGCEFASGRASDGLNQACSLEFRLGGVDWDCYAGSEIKTKDQRWTELIENAAREGWQAVADVENHLNWITHIPGRPEHCSKDEVGLCFAHSRRCNPLDNHDLTRMYLEGREQADLLWRFIMARVPGFEDCWLIDTAGLLGVRDSRRILGDDVVTGWDIASRKHHDDVVTISQHCFDIHNPDGPGNIKWIKAKVRGEERYVIAHMGGFGSTRFPPGGPEVLCDAEGRTGQDMDFPTPTYYDIPYRSLVPTRLDNLLVAGRCLSADFEGQSGCRLIMACMSMGEAAGTASGISLRQNIAPRKIDRLELQSKLVTNGMNIGQEFRPIPGLTPDTFG